MNTRATERWRAAVPRTATGTIDHTAIEARARHLRRMHLSALLDAVTRWTVRAAARLAARLRAAISTARAGRSSCRI